MLFNSYIFIFLFFPICLAGYYGLLHLHKDWLARLFLVAMSFWFYGYFNLSYLLIMVCSIAGNYLFHRLLSRKRDRSLMVLAVAANLGVLFYFKYVDFFLSTVNSVFGSSFALRGILLPLGISFFTFQQISFVVDTYRGEVRDCPFVSYALFVAFFPQLVAGPIVNHSEMLPQFEKMGRNPVPWERIAQGCGLFILGLAKKVLLADTFGAGVDYGYANLPVLGRFDAILVALFYLLQLYFDFSGYCDMARGIGKMLGMELPVNFNSPYKAVNIVDFWKRWHITLNRFFTKYVYIPLGGNRKGQARMYRNLMIVFLLSGIWHGAGWTFVVWGGMHGVLYVITRAWQNYRKERDVYSEEAHTATAHSEEAHTATAHSEEAHTATAHSEETHTAMAHGEEAHAATARREEAKTAVAKGAEAHGMASGLGHKIMTFVSRVLLLVYVGISKVYFRAESVAQANQMLRTAVKGPVQRISMDLAECFRLDEFWYVLKVLHLDNLAYSRSILMWLCLAVGIYLSMIGKNAAERMEQVKYRPLSVVVFAVLTVWCVLTFSEVSTFLYFNF